MESGSVGRALIRGNYGDARQLRGRSNYGLRGRSNHGLRGRSNCGDAVCFSVPSRRKPLARRASSSCARDGMSACLTGEAPVPRWLRLGAGTRWSARCPPVVTVPGRWIRSGLRGVGRGRVGRGRLGLPGRMRGGRRRFFATGCCDARLGTDDLRGRVRSQSADLGCRHYCRSLWCSRRC
jgi:hypothetical protein